MRIQQRKSILHSKTTSTTSIRKQVNFFPYVIVFVIFIQIVFRLLRLQVLSQVHSSQIQSIPRGVIHKKGIPNDIKRQSFPTYQRRFYTNIDTSISKSCECEERAKNDKGKRYSEKECALRILQNSTFHQVGSSFQIQNWNQNFSSFRRKWFH